MAALQNHQSNTGMYKRIIAVIVIAVFLAMTIPPERHNHTDNDFHADCAGCIKMHHQAVAIDIAPFPSITYVMSSHKEILFEGLLCPFFSPQINPRAPPV
jgi:hypothetical protein